MALKTTAGGLKTSLTVRCSGATTGVMSTSWYCGKIDEPVHCHATRGVNGPFGGWKLHAPFALRH
jgi:hypothetical protein